MPPITDFNFRMIILIRYIIDKVVHKKFHIKLLQCMPRAIYKPCGPTHMILKITGKKRGLVCLPSVYPDIWVIFKKMKTFHFQRII